jgi:hypothetical protein
MNKFLQEYHQVFAFIFLLIGSYIIFFSGGSGGFKYFRPDFYSFLIIIDSIFVWYFFTYNKNRISKFAWILGFIFTAWLGHNGLYFANAGKEAQVYYNLSKCSDLQINEYTYNSKTLTLFGNEQKNYISNKDLDKGKPFNITTNYEELGSDYPKFIYPDNIGLKFNITGIPYALKTNENIDKFNRFYDCVQDKFKEKFVKCENIIYSFRNNQFNYIDCKLNKLIENYPDNTSETNEKTIIEEIKE